MSSKIDEIQKFVDTVGSCGLYPDKAAGHIRYLLSLKDGGVEERGCPCLYGSPCDTRCTCINPHSSRGCAMCCSYGSVEQRQMRAKSLRDLVEAGLSADERANQICACGDPKSQHEMFSDHDECLGCRGLDEPCSEFRATASTETSERCGECGADDHVTHAATQFEIEAEGDIAPSTEQKGEQGMHVSEDLYEATKDFWPAPAPVAQPTEPHITVPAQWIIDHHDRVKHLDYACEECCRDRDDSTVVDGFLCVYHRALIAIKAAPTAAPAPVADPWVDSQGHIWERRLGVDCVECPHCLFIFAAQHTDGDTDGYNTCPNCDGCEPSTVPQSTVAVEGAKLRRIVCEVVHQHVPVTVQLPHGINGLEEALVDAFSRYLVAQEPVGDGLPMTPQQMRQQLAEAAREIPCAGPIAHRIRVLKREHEDEIARLNSEVERLKESELFWKIDALGHFCSDCGDGDKRQVGHYCAGCGGPMAWKMKEGRKTYKQICADRDSARADAIKEAVEALRALPDHDTSCAVQEGNVCDCSFRVSAQAALEALAQNKTVRNSQR